MWTPPAAAVCQIRYLVEGCKIQEAPITDIERPSDSEILPPEPGLPVADFPPFPSKPVTDPPASKSDVQLLSHKRRRTCDDDSPDEDLQELEHDVPKEMPVTVTNSSFSEPSHAAVDVAAIDVIPSDVQAALASQQPSPPPEVATSPQDESQQARAPDKHNEEGSICVQTEGSQSPSTNKHEVRARDNKQPCPPTASDLSADQMAEASHHVMDCEVTQDPPTPPSADVFPSRTRSRTKVQPNVNAVRKKNKPNDTQVTVLRGPEPDHLLVEEAAPRPSPPETKDAPIVTNQITATNLSAAQSEQQVTPDDEGHAAVAAAENVVLQDPEGPQEPDQTVSSDSEMSRPRHSPCRRKKQRIAPPNADQTAKEVREKAQRVARTLGGTPVAQDDGIHQVLIPADILATAEPPTPPTERMVVHATREVTPHDLPMQTLDGDTPEVGLRATGNWADDVENVPPGGDLNDDPMDPEGPQEPDQTVSSDSEMSRPRHSPRRRKKQRIAPPNADQTAKEVREKAQRVARTLGGPPVAQDDGIHQVLIPADILATAEPPTPPTERMVVHATREVTPHDLPMQTLDGDTPEVGLRATGNWADDVENVPPGGDLNDDPMVGVGTAVMRGVGDVTDGLPPRPSDQ
ncbi:fibrous sheath CABYR-binding protein-like [Schistocerca serialis cubense]|uniref:fibrous sheath CABYR-binding protein-like n=1 Tax=Schistocerca serialis cubense TaxID=2023355 RepID=UPI00214E049F|nr:fibrous sheath CABYR-binding protein-like [Schistocerca serialis cubense]